MSLRGEMQRQAGDLLNAIQKAAKKGNVTRRGAFVGTQKMLGYVCNIHDDESDELYGTVDVQEYDEDYENVEAGVGHHEGVLLSAVQKNGTGYLIIPELYSSVVITQDPVSLEEYILSYTNVRELRLMAHQAVTIGVESLSDMGDGIEDETLDTVERTGKSAVTKYSDEVIVNKVVDSDNEAMSSLSTSGYIIKVNDMEIKVSADDIQIGGSSDNAVSFLQLKAFLSKLLNYLSTATAAGSPLSTSANIAALQSELESIKSQIIKTGE